jgi:hypothetical protein
MRQRRPPARLARRRQRWGCPDGAAPSGALGKGRGWCGGAESRGASRGASREVWRREAPGAGADWRAGGAGAAARGSDGNGGSAVMMLTGGIEAEEGKS